MATSGTFQSQRLPIWGHPARMLLVLLGAGSAVLLLALPFAAIFHYALRDGWAAYWGYLTEPSTRHAIWLSLVAVAIAVPVNTFFGLMAAWAIAKFEFWGKKLLISLIELPLSVSPVVIGLAYLFVFGMQGLLGEWLMEREIRLVFNVTAIVVVTTIVTMPFVFRELLPLMQSQGTDDEVAALTLGARGWTVFFRITLPNIKWALIYGICLCLARGLGEFGSVLVVSGAIRNQTNTMPLQIDLLFNDFVQTGAFAVATVLTSIALVTMLIKTWVEFREAKRLERAAG